MAVWTFLLIACSLIGIGLLNWLKADSFEKVGDRVIAALWLGVIVLAVSLLATSLVFPLSPLVGAIVILTWIALSFLSQPTRTEILTLRSFCSPALISGLLTLELAIAAFTTQQVTWIDTGLYHYGVIQWLSKFGTVPGIALLFTNLGFTSSWFALAAPLNAEIFDSRVSAVTNGFALLIAGLHFLISLTHCFSHQAKITDWFTVISSLIILPIVIFHNLVSVILISPSPDLPIIFLTQVVAWSILITASQVKPDLEKLKRPILDSKTIPLILSAGAVTLKLTALPLLLISSLFYLVDKKLSIRRIFLGSAIVALLLLPMFSYGIITSGCPLYPSSFLCLDLPWAVTVQQAQTVAERTHGWFTWYGSPPANTNPWLWLLWKWFSETKANQAIAFVLVISMIFGIYIVRSLMNSKVRGQIWLVALEVCGISFIMMTAPFFRFAFGYAIILPALFLALFCQKKLGNNLSLNNRLIAFYQSNSFKKVLLISPLFLGTLILLVLINQGLAFRLLLPPKLPQIKVIQKQVNDIVFFSPESSPKLCWATELPCAFEVKENLYLRNSSRGIQAGFIRKD
jgi:hypothetical protein